MSESRLEKFLYALYSLDSSDLPTPLSRIEELYKCLVTGEEAPTFEPISRTEKYLMAILGVYDVDLLPNPISRVEVLLYKLATGDDNLDDVKSFLSEHEELLAEIIRNGGVGGNIDIEYVSHTLSTEFNTLYNTAEKPVKSAILKGDTLVNISPLNGVITLAPGSVQFIDIPTIKSNTIYTISFNCSSLPSTNFIEFRQAFDNTALKMDNIPVVQGYNRFKITTVNKKLNRVRFKNDTTSETDIIFNNLMILEGDYTNINTPYIEGMQSIKMPVLTITGKNLFNPNWQLNTWYPFKLKSGTKLTLSTKDNAPSKGGNIRLMATDETDIWMGIDEGTTQRTITLKKDVYKLSNMLNGNMEYQLEIGDNTPYEPYQSNILTVNEEVELGSVGEVKDELDLLTGKITQRTDIRPYQESDESDSEVLTDMTNTRYKLAQEVVKTVDLSTVNQDGNDTKLSTFNDLTHVTLSSEGLIPEAKLEVATKNEEDLEDTSVYTVHTLSEGYNTLYNTAEKSVKSAILKGQTLVNLLSASNIKGSKSYYTIDYVHNLDTTKTHILKYRINQIPELNDVTDSGRLLKFEWYNGSVISGCRDIYNKDITVGGNNFIIINPYNDEVLKTNFSVWIPNYVSGNLDMDVMIIEYQEGMENCDIPYFEGMQSVKMPVLTTVGKNLFDEVWESGSFNGTTGEDITDSNTVRSKNYIKVNPNETYTIDTNAVKIFYDKNYKVISVNTSTSIDTTTFNTPENCYYMRIRMSYSDYSNNKFTKQIEQGTQATPYEAFKSNILTVNEEVELHGVGDVKDELNLLTGELTERIGEIVFDGSIDEGWWQFDNSAIQEKTCLFAYYGGLPSSPSENLQMICDKFTISKDGYSALLNTDKEMIHVYADKTVYFRVLKSKLSTQDAAGFKEWLSQNPFIIQYQLATPVVKTVDLSVVDQDGNDTELSTFNDITHVTLSSEGLIPEAELEVAEKVTEVAASMLTISREQEVIDTTTNEQSENVDATMIATTEIYEDLL